MQSSPFSRLLVAASGACIVALAVPSVASAATAGSDLSPAQKAQIAASDRATTKWLVAEALLLRSTVDPKAAPGDRGGSYPTRKGTFMSTDTKVKGLIPTGHSAMVYSSSYVVESVSSGVVWGYNNWYSTKPHVWGMTTRGTTASQDATAASWAAGRIGKPYNYNYFDMGTRSRFYCSQLVWAAFRDNFGIDLNTGSYDAGPLHAIHPMELPSSANSSKVSTFYTK